MAPAPPAASTPAARSPIESPGALDRKLRAHSAKDSPRSPSLCSQATSEQQQEKLRAAELWKQLLSEKAARKARLA